MLDQWLVDRMDIVDVSQALDAVATGLAHANLQGKAEVKPELLRMAKQLIRRKGDLVNGPDRVRRRLPPRP